MAGFQRGLQFVLPEGLATGWTDGGDEKPLQGCSRRFVLAAGTEGPESDLLAPGVYEGSHGH